MLSFESLNMSEILRLETEEVALCRCRFRYAGDRRDVLAGSGNALLSCFGTDFKALDMDEGRVGEAQESENAAEIGFLEVEQFGRCIAAVDAAASSDDEDLLTFEQSLGSCRGVAERATGARDVIDPRLQGRRDREIVHGYGEHDDVGSFELLDQVIGEVDACDLLGRALLRRCHQCPKNVQTKMWDRVRSQCPRDDGGAGMGAAPRLDQLASDLCRFRLAAKQARGDQQNLAHNTLLKRCDFVPSI